MSFWDTQEADEEVTTQSLIEKGNPDIKELLQCEDLFTSFRSKEDYLIEQYVFLLKNNILTQQFDKTRRHEEITAINSHFERKKTRKNIRPTICRCRKSAPPRIL